jgi:CheY-like chemotaxis protein
MKRHNFKTNDEVMVMGQKLLIIDDDENDVLLTKSILSKIAPEVTIEVASSGEEGLALLRNETVLPALILLDVKMPGMSGIDVLHKIRDEKRLNPVPVVVVTHSIIKDDLLASFKLGANSILLKSGNTDEFRRSIRNLIERFIEK